MKNLFYVYIPLLLDYLKILLYWAINYESYIKINKFTVFIVENGIMYEVLVTQTVVAVILFCGVYFRGLFKLFHELIKYKRRPNIVA